MKLIYPKKFELPDKIYIEHGDMHFYENGNEISVERGKNLGYSLLKTLNFVGVVIFSGDRIVKYDYGCGKEIVQIQKKAVK